MKLCVWFLEHISDCRFLGPYLNLQFKNDEGILKCLRLLTHVGFFSKTGSNTFKSVLIYGKEQESRKKYFITVQKTDLPEKV